MLSDTYNPMIHNASTYNDIIHFIHYAVILHYNPWAGRCPLPLIRSRKPPKFYYIVKPHFAFFSGKTNVDQTLVFSYFLVVQKEWMSRKTQYFVKGKCAKHTINTPSSISPFLFCSGTMYEIFHCPSLIVLSQLT